MLEKRRKEMTGMIMFELDYQANGKPPYSNFEAAKISRDYLAKLNYKFDEKTA
jgi:inosose dehydratase